MQIIVAHDMTDLDGLAAMIAAGKLYDKAQPVFVGNLDSQVSNLMALYRDELSILNPEDVVFDQLTRVIVVDTYDLDRLGPLGKKINWADKNLEVIMYDHHPHTLEDIPRVDLDLSREVGSATTILVNRIRAENQQLNPVEATVCALGIYADTGNFTHQETTAEDLSAVAFLMESGANMKIINEFLEEKLNAEQQEVYNLLQDNREDLVLEGVRISLFTLKYSTYVPGLNKVITRLKSLLNIEVLFIIVEMEGETVVIARSSSDAVNAGLICRYLGGGGHKGAASVQLEQELKEARRNVISALKRGIRSVTKIKDIMTEEVHTIGPDTKISEAEKLMDRHGHNGLVVCEQGAIKGVFSRRDIKKVRGHDLMHAPVKGYMSKNVIKIEPTAPVFRARDLLVKYNIGRLPVVKEGKLLGIVTRSDVIESYYNEPESPFKYQNIYGSSLVQIEPHIIDIKDKLQHLKTDIREKLKIIGEIGRDNEARVFLIGGRIRDLLLGRYSRDLDFVVEGDVRQLASEIANHFGVKWSYNENFSTANIELQGYNLDLAATRREYYPAPGALPEVEEANILVDLFRRDYTVNALALNIGPESWGRLIDFFHGCRDLEEKKLRILHRFSFLDDPTRIIRGIRLALELDFTFEKETSELAREALSAGEFSGLSLARTFQELETLFQFEFTEQFLLFLKKYPVFKLLDINIKIDKQRIEKLIKLEEFMAELSSADIDLQKWSLRMTALTGGLPDNVLQELNLSGNTEQILSSAAEYINRLKEADSFWDRLEILDYMLPDTVVLCWYELQDEELKLELEKYLKEVKDIKPEIDGNKLQELGLKPGPRIKEVLGEIRKSRILGEVENRSQEIELAHRLIKKIRSRN